MRFVNLSTLVKVQCTLFGVWNVLTNKRSDGEFLPAVIKKLHQQLPKKQAQRAQLLATLYASQVAHDEMLSIGSECLAAMVISKMEFGNLRKPDQICVQVINSEETEFKHTVIEIVNDDMPFLVDSVSTALADHGIDVHLVIHPIVNVERDSDGALLEFGAFDPSAPNQNPESWMRFEIDKQNASGMAMIKRYIVGVLDDVRFAIRDWQAMRTKAQNIVESFHTEAYPFDQLVVEESVAFIKWMGDNHFTFLGYREYRIFQEKNEYFLQAQEGSGLGILDQARHKNGQSEPSLIRLTKPEHDGPVVITKTNSRATVHRPGYMDYISILLYNADGDVVGERRFLGLFTSGAYNRQPWQIPIVRKKVDAIMAQSKLAYQSHGGKALLHILEILPRDELFQSNVSELTELCIGILRLQERHCTRLFIRRDQFERYFSCLVFIPRDRFNTDIRQRIQDILFKALQGKKLDFTVQVSESVLARLHVVIRHQQNETINYDINEIEALIIDAVRSWQDELQDILIKRSSITEGMDLANQFIPFFPISYVEDVSPWVASFDVEKIATLNIENDLQLSLYRPRKRKIGLLRFKVFKKVDTIPLSSIVPLLENLGFHVVSERPYEIAMPGEASIWIQDFDMSPIYSSDIDIDLVRDKFQTAFANIWHANAEDDRFNTLVLIAQLDWRQISMIRGYCKYLLQTGVPFSQPYMEQTLLNHPHITRLMVELFQALFDPARDNEAAEVSTAAADVLANEFKQIAQLSEQSALGSVVLEIFLARKINRTEQIQASSNALQVALESVGSIDEDRILRAFSDVILATVRTNFFQQDGSGKRSRFYSYKIDSMRVPNLPKPRPKFEIFVFSTSVEGIHLRGGSVARGGLRWSDRREDFRTEVLGLMKAQSVKNTMIVPVGAKGGFVVKSNLIGKSRDEKMEEVVACYRQFIHGLLSVTDNLIEGKVVHPRLTVRHDADDPYLVVAADKGTATFSDIANSISAEHGFWMGDAFASGGSVGYDHKKMAITARGAWESVKRHFREIGIDCQNEAFSCVGIGDMAGDVFGNGMLLSRKIKLIAAFNHLHIFIDPSPNTETSFIERERLFHLPGSSWEDYATDCISPGGGVYSRSAKSIPLSPQIRSWLGISDEELTPVELIRQLLLAQVDLLWNGGIGTYVKAKTETHEDVGDRANNALRVDGDQLRCKIIGEGGNLGFTQNGRIEFALAGGKVNTDFIDNSAGVDCSDHEVNIKILLNHAVTSGIIDVKKRNELLVEMTDEVAKLVLNNNYSQTLAISMMEAFTAKRIGAQAHFIHVLENQGLIDRELECLPTDDQLAERRAKSKGFTRPELATLLSYSKITTYVSLLGSDVPEDAFLYKELKRYFPTQLHQFEECMDTHQLKREIIATNVTNSMVNRMGATFSLRMQEDTGAHPAAIAKAYTIAREIFKVRDLWEEINSLDNRIDTKIQIDMILVIWNLLRQTTRWILNNGGNQWEIEDACQRFSPGIAELKTIVSGITGEFEAKKCDAIFDRFTANKVDKVLARNIADIPALYAALDIVSVAEGSQGTVNKVAEVYFKLSETLNLNWLLDEIENLTVEGHWHAHARGALRDDLYRHQRRLVAAVIDQNEGEDVDEMLLAWTASCCEQLAHARRMMQEMKAVDAMDYATVSVAINTLQSLTHPG